MRDDSAHEPRQEATELSALFLRVETVFAGGDVPAIADTLATMRRSLLLVGDVPEFKGGMQRLEVWLGALPLTGLAVPHRHHSYDLALISRDWCTSRWYYLLRS